MAKIATKLEDIGDERDQAVFMAAVKLWYNGDIQLALADYNDAQAEDEKNEIQKSNTTPSDKSEIYIRFSRQ